MRRDIRCQGVVCVQLGSRRADWSRLRRRYPQALVEGVISRLAIDAAEIRLTGRTILDKLEAGAHEDQEATTTFCGLSILRYRPGSDAAAAHALQRSTRAAIVDNRDSANAVYVDSKCNVALANVETKSTELNLHAS